jgi:hypothetical protein
MMEKNGAVQLTEDDLSLVKLGSVPEGVKDAWDFTLKQIQEVVANNDYVLIDNIKKENNK